MTLTLRSNDVTQSKDFFSLIIELYGCSFVKSNNSSTYFVNFFSVMFMNRF